LELNQKIHSHIDQFPVQYIPNDRPNSFSALTGFLPIRTKGRPDKAPRSNAGPVIYPDLQFRILNDPI
jgi:hypothetical protein